MGVGRRGEQAGRERGGDGERGEAGGREEERGGRGVVVRRDGCVSRPKKGNGEGKKKSK